MKRNLSVASLALLALTLAACGGSATAPPQGVDGDPSTTDSPTQAEVQSTIEPTAEAEELPHPELPTASPVTGEQVSAGAMTLTLPAGFVFVDVGEETMWRFEGENFGEVMPDGTQGRYAVTVSTAEAVPGWDGTLQPNGVSEGMLPEEVYSARIAGAEHAALRLSGRDVAYQFVDSGQWKAPYAYAGLVVQSADGSAMKVDINAPAGPEGLAFIASLLPTISLS